MNTSTTFKLNLIMASVAFAMTGLATAAYAEEAPVEEPIPEYTFLDSIKDGKNMTNFRIRYENIDLDAYQGTTPTAAKQKRAEAFTLRSLVGWQTAPYKNFSFGIQLTDVHEFNDNFNDRRENQPEHNNNTGLASLNKRQYPNIVDPGFTDVNQAYIDWTGIKNTRVRVGRQQVNLDNVRFVGDIAFRQNMQVFDGVSVLNKSIPDTELFVAHFDQVRQITTELRQGNIEVLNAKYRISPSESLIGYGYLIDSPNLGQNGGNPAALGSAAQGGNGLGGSDDIPASATNFNPTQTDASSKTFGARLDGVRKLDDNWKVLYTAEYAKQMDYKGGNPLIDAHYYKVGGGAMYDVWSLRIDQEKLSSNDGKYAFQTPMGTNHLFQGWADHFLTTPRQGIVDTYITFSGSIQKAKLYAEYHVFKSDEKFQSLGHTLANPNLKDKFGTEFDAAVTYPFTDKMTGKVEYARYSEKDVYGTTLQNAARKGDKEMFWVTAQYTF